MKLQDEIKQFNEQALPSLPSETINIMTKAAEDLAGSGIVSQALGKGDDMPAFSMPDATGKTVSSEELLARGPLVISFNRGSW